MAPKRLGWRGNTGCISVTGVVGRGWWRNLGELWEDLSVYLCPCHSMDPMSPGYCSWWALRLCRHGNFPHCPPGPPLVSAPFCSSAKRHSLTSCPRTTAWWWKSSWDGERNKEVSINRQPDWKLSVMHSIFWFIHPTTCEKSLVSPHRFCNFISNLLSKPSHGVLQKQVFNFKSVR